MSCFEQRKIVRILFDEYHSESWTVSEANARAIQPDNPAASSYQTAANALQERDFRIERNLDQPLKENILSNQDVLVVVHPCNPKWEKTTSINSPQLSAIEIENIQKFVWRGGGLVVITEYEHDKYGDNLNSLLLKFGLQIQNTTVSDPSACWHDNHTWIFGNPTQNVSQTLAHFVERTCFYRSATCTARDEAKLAWMTSDQARPKKAGLIGISQYGNGRVVLVSDSSLFGDQHFKEFDHQQLWLNLFYWCSTTAFKNSVAIEKVSPVSQSPAWLSLKTAVNELRLLQAPDGSVEQVKHVMATELVRVIMTQIAELQKFFSHQVEYLRQVLQDLENWITSDFRKPDFSKSLAEFNPQRLRRNQIENLVVFPMYTPNSSRDTRFEALIVRMPWPDWLSDLEKTSYQNDKFAPGYLLDFTDGYKSECAVLFPETVSVHEKATNNFSTIFCDREAKRLQSYSLKAVKIFKVETPPRLECFLNSLVIIQDTTALWDLIHDKSHSMGELPFDPFMIRQKAPFWMYGLEELRVDLRSFIEASRLVREGFSFAEYVTYAILFDRIFRFPITGPRIRNYDALGGQLLFSFLHQKDVLIWSDNKLTIKWNLLLNGISELRQEIRKLYKDGADSSKLSFWIEAHDLVSKYMKPNVASRWKKDSRAITDETDPKKWISLVHDDEFPLGNFHVHLLSKIARDG
jgi:hypothetical protein